MEQEAGRLPPQSSGHMAAGWARIRGRLREEVGEVEYRTWLRQMTLAGVEGEDAVILLPTRFLRDWVNSHYGDRLRLLWQAEEPSVRRVDIRVSATPVAEAVPPRNAWWRSRPAQPASPSRWRLASPRHGPAPKPAPTGSCRSRRASPSTPSSSASRTNSPMPAPAGSSEKPASPGFNPLFLYGGVGLGKTHLMHAIAWAIRANDPSRTVAYMSAEKFMYRFIAALRSQNTMEFKETLRAVDVLMIDDLQFLIGKDNTQEEFFHTFNALVDQGKQIIVSSDKSPSDLAGIEDRLRTRLGCGMVADIHATTYELRLSILQAKAAAAQVLVPPKVLELLAHKITANVRELEGALNRLVAHANLFGRPITIDGAHEVLHDVLRAHEKRVSIEEIQRKVADHYNIRLTDMSSARRARNVARPRQVAMYLAKQLTQRSLPEIGRRFGNRDHTTVMHAVSRVAELMAADAGFAEDVTLLRKMLET